MAPSITWLHLSDLHACNPRTGWDAGDVLADLRADLARLREDHGLAPDLIFFTGDAGFGQLGTAEGKSLAEQLDLAEGFFRGVRATCGVDQDRFFIVPGNHDVDRDKVNVSDTAWLDALIGQGDADVVALLRQGGSQWQSVLGRLDEYRAFLERHGYDHLLDDPERLLFTCVREIAGVKLGVAGFNTAWSCCRSPERGKLWWGGRWQVKELASRLADCDLRVALSHHPGGWFTEAEDPAADDMLKRRFDLRLHGHEHRGWIELVSRVTDERDHLRISAGACYAASEKEKGYNLGRLDPATGTVEVFLRRYDQTGEGWVAHQLARRTKSDGCWRSEPLRQLVALPGAGPADAAPHLAPRPAPRTLLLSSLVRGTDLVARLGAEGAARAEQRHDRLARDLLAAQRGREIDRTDDGLLLLFDRPIDALRHAVSYHDALAGLDEQLAARVGIHHGEVVEREMPLEIGAMARLTTARVTALAGAGQTLLTSSAFQIARRGAVGQPEAEALSWRAHGRYRSSWLGEPVEIFEAGRPRVAPLVPPAGSAGAERLDVAPDKRSRRLAKGLAEARARRDGMRLAGEATREVDAEIVGLRRELREGGHLNPGDTLCEGRFQLVEKIGQGGYAVVWKAWDAEGLAPVALKVLHGQHVHDLSRRERFFRGARLMSELAYGVVDVVERELIDDDFHFYAMELVEGGDFQHACQQGRLTLDERLRVITQVADALGQAHDRDVIHRDVKPSNILLDAGGSPRLTGFDLVLAGDTTGGTRTQAMLGTFLYMAPEVMANAQEARPASDVFSLGMTAIFAVYGDELPPAVFRGGDDFVARLPAPEAVCAVLLKAIAWELPERYSSMAEFAAALRRAMAAGASPELPVEAVLRIEAGMHGAMIRRVDADAAGRFLVTGSDDKTARVWDLRRGELLRVLRPPIGDGGEGKVYAVALTPDAEVVAVGGWIGYERDQKHSIYLFERRNGQLLRRIAGLPNVVLHLVFSPDGLRLAAVLGAANGLRVFRVTDGEELHRDTDYGADSYGASFDVAGRLITSCIDGRLRLYAADHQRLAMVSAPGGVRPYAVAFSLEGGRIAVGYADSTRVDVVSGDDLALLYSADTEGTMSSVAFSGDGDVLFAAGRFNVAGRCPIRRWDDGGRGAFRDLPGPFSTVMDLRALPGGRLVYGAGDPAWGVYQGDRPFARRGPAMADPRGLLEDFRIDASGTRVCFAFESYGKRPALFSLAECRLEVGEATLAAASTLEGPQTTAPEGTGPGAQVTGWKNTTEPRLGGKRLPLEQHEMSRSLALAADASGFLLGTEWRLRFFTRDGEERWQKPVPGVAWAVNLTPDVRLAVAAYGDGTIRWHRVADGEELLAFFPHRDGRRWVLWTPSGYWDASPGGETLIGWHVNQGEDREAVFHPAWRFGKERHRPGVIDRILHTMSEAEAVRLAAETLSDLPDGPFEREGLRIAHRFRKATTTAGDFYDVVTRQDGGVGIYLVDVTGYGLPATLQAFAIKKALLRAGADWGTGVAKEQLARADRAIDEELNDPTEAATMCFLEIDIQEMKARFANAGMPFPLLFRAGQGQPEVLRAAGVYVGGGYARYPVKPRQAEVDLDEGDVIVLYSDGILEASDSRGRKFGQEGVVGCVARAGLGSLEELADEIVRAVTQHARSQLPVDDQSLVVVGIGESVDKRGKVRTLEEVAASESGLELSLMNAQDAAPACHEILRPRLKSWVSDQGLDNESSLQVWSATWEALQNAVQHGSRRGDILRIHAAQESTGNVRIEIVQSQTWSESEQFLGRDRLEQIQRQEEIPLGGTVIMLRLASRITVSHQGRKVRMDFDSSRFEN